MQLILEIAISPNVALCVEAYTRQLWSESALCEQYKIPLSFIPPIQNTYLQFISWCVGTSKATARFINVI